MFRRCLMVLLFLTACTEDDDCALTATCPYYPTPEAGAAPDAAVDGQGGVVDGDSDSPDETDAEGSASDAEDEELSAGKDDEGANPLTMLPPPVTLPAGAAAEDAGAGGADASAGGQEMAGTADESTLAEEDPAGSGDSGVDDPTPEGEPELATDEATDVESTDDTDTDETEVTDEPECTDCEADSGAVVPVDPCAADPCGPNAVECIAQGDDAYECVCGADWDGDHCEIALDGCEADPCVNATGCTPNGADYTCACEDGWDGQNCDELVSACTVLDPCVNATACNDVDDTYECVCQSGWDGANCDVELNGCDVDPCQNGGVCDDLGLGQYACDCDGTGFTGDECELARFEVLALEQVGPQITSDGSRAFLRVPDGMGGFDSAQWTVANGLQVVWAGGVSSEVSSDGSRLLFEGTDPGYVENGLFYPLDSLPGTLRTMSGNGLVFFGSGTNQRIWSWSAQAGGRFPLFNAGGAVSAANWDGSIVVGQVNPDALPAPDPPLDDSRPQGYIYDMQSDELQLVGVPGDSSPEGNSVLVSVSDDGQIAAGHSSGVPIVVNQGVASLLPMPVGLSTGSYTTCISGDGTHVVGWVSDGGFHAWIWNASDGTRLLEDVVEDLGVDLTGWSDFRPLDVSADGSVIVGVMDTSDGPGGAFLMRLD